MKEEWLFPNAIVPVDVETTAALVAEIHRLIGVVGGMALAQPEQEPVAWELRAGKTDRVLIEITNNPQRAHDWKASLEEVVPLYTAPPPQRKWVGLTDEEYQNIRYGSDESGELYVSYGEYDEGYECGSEIEIYVDDFAKAIEAKLKEKNGG